MRVFVVICLLGSQMVTYSFGQTVPCDTVYTMVDEMPMFANGYEDLVNYLTKTLDFGSCELHVTKTLTWTINRLGDVIDIDAPGLEGECRSRVIGQLANFPKWTPGKLMGMPVCVRTTLRKS
jgi:hypothetical protein